MLLGLFSLGVLGLCINAQSVENFEKDYLNYDLNETESTVHLENSGIELIHRAFVSSNKIKYLNLQNNKIREIESSAFDGLPNLEYINLKNNHLNYTNFLDGNSYPNVKTLILDNALVDVQNDSTKCDDEICEKDLLISTPLPKLQHLYLRKNNLTSFTVASWKKNAPDLTHLIMSYNELKTIDFLNDETSALTHLWIDHNQIDWLVNASLTNMVLLNLDFNKIYTLCETENECNGAKLKGATNLKHLSLSNVELSYIYPNSMQDLVSLRTLDLSYNALIEIDADIFNNTKNLLTIMLQGNNLTSIPKLCSLNKLTSLYLNKNRISRIDHDTFPCDLPELNYLLLNNNMIDFIDSGAFAILSQLKTLSLSGNNLSVLSDGWIYHGSSLQVLDLSYNSITDFNNINLNNATNLKELRVFRNLLNSIPAKALKNLSEDLIIHLY